MTGINELRQALNDQAADVSDHAVATRSGEIRERVRVVRRRRRVTIAGSAAAILAVGAGVALLPNQSPSPTPEVASIVGLTPPEELSSLGYTYAFDRGLEGDGDSISVDLAASDVPRLLSWATEGDDDTVSVTDDLLGDEEAATYRSSDFSDFILVGPGESGTIDLRSDDGSEVGVAIYTVDLDARPPGLSDGGATFRDEVAGQRLLTAEVGAPGVSDLEVQAMTNSELTATAYFCAGAPRGTVLHIESPQSVLTSRQDCDGPTPVDVTPSRSTQTGTGVNWATRIYLTDGPSGPVIEGDDVQIGVALYTVPNPAGSGVFQQAAPDLVEYRGHTYQRDEILEAPRGAKQARLLLDDADQPALAFGYARARSGVTQFTFQSVQIGVGAGGDVASIGLGLFSGPDAAVVLRRSGDDETSQAAVVTYVRVD